MREEDGDGLLALCFFLCEFGFALGEGCGVVVEEEGLGDGEGGGALVFIFDEGSFLFAGVEGFGVYWGSSSSLLFLAEGLGGVGYLLLLLLLLLLLPLTGWVAGIVAALERRVVSSLVPGFVIPSLISRLLPVSVVLSVLWRNISLLSFSPLPLSLWLPCAVLRFLL